MEQYRLGEYIGTDSRELEQEIIYLLEQLEAEEVDISDYEVWC